MEPYLFETPKQLFILWGKRIGAIFYGIYRTCRSIVMGMCVLCFTALGVQIERSESEEHSGSHCCLVAIGRLQVTSTPNCSDMSGPNAATEFISRHSVDGKFTFVDQR